MLLCITIFLLLHVLTSKGDLETECQTHRKPCLCLICNEHRQQWSIVSFTSMGGYPALPVLWVDTLLCLFLGETLWWHFMVSVTSWVVSFSLIPQQERHAWSLAISNTITKVHSWPWSDPRTLLPSQVQVLILKVLLFLMEQGEYY